MTQVQDPPQIEAPTYAPVFFWINAVVAWCAVGLSFVLSISGYYVDAARPVEAVDPRQHS